MAAWRAGDASSGRALAPAMAGPVDQDDAMVLLEPVAERKPHVLEIAARAVQQHDRRIVVGGLGARRRDRPHAGAPADLHEPAGGRMSALDPARADEREPAASTAKSESRIPMPITVMRSNRTTMRRPD